MSAEILKQHRNYRQDKYGQPNERFTVSTRLTKGIPHGVINKLFDELTRDLNEIQPPLPKPLEEGDLLFTYRQDEDQPGTVIAEVSFYRFDATTLPSSLRKLGFLMSVFPLPEDGFGQTQAEDSIGEVVRLPVHSTDELLPNIAVAGA